MSIIRIPHHLDMDTLPPFRGLPLNRIVSPASPAEFVAAVEDISAFPSIGFDTESKPTFKVGEVSSGPHLIQFATPHKAYLFRIAVPGCIEAARTVLQAPELVKVGFGLSSDRSRLRSKLGIQPVSLLDLGAVLRYHGKKGQVGLRGAVAGVLGARVNKSRSVATSNWSKTALTEAQQNYAANDAFAALQVFLGLDAEQQQSLLNLAKTPADRSHKKRPAPASSAVPAEE